MKVRTKLRGDTPDWQQKIQGSEGLLSNQRKDFSGYNVKVLDG